MIRWAGLFPHAQAHADNLEAIHTAHIFRAIEMLGLGGGLSYTWPCVSSGAPDKVLSRSSARRPPLRPAAVKGPMHRSHGMV